MSEDMYAIYCPAKDGYHIGPITIQECAEILADIAFFGTCGAEHKIELIEFTNDEPETEVLEGPVLDRDPQAFWAGLA